MRYLTLILTATLFGCTVQMPPAPVADSGISGDAAPSCEPLRPSFTARLDALRAAGTACSPDTFDAFGCLVTATPAADSCDDRFARAQSCAALANALYDCETGADSGI